MIETLTEKLLLKTKNDPAKRLQMIQSLRRVLNTLVYNGGYDDENPIPIQLAQDLQECQDILLLLSQDLDDVIALD